MKIRIIITFPLRWQILSIKPNQLLDRKGKSDRRDDWSTVYLIFFFSNISLQFYGTQSSLRIIFLTEEVSIDENNDKYSIKKKKITGKINQRNYYRNLYILYSIYDHFARTKERLKCHVVSFAWISLKNDYVEKKKNVTAKLIKSLFKNEDERDILLKFPSKKFLHFFEGIYMNVLYDIRNTSPQFSIIISHLR